MEEMRHEVEVDTQLAELWTERDKLVTYLHDAKLSLAHQVGIRPHYVTKFYRDVNESAEDLMALVKDAITIEVAPWKVNEMQRAIDRYDEYDAALTRNREARLPLEAEYQANPWSRFFLVQNNNGHIHSSLSCSTCNMRTRFAWLPTVSGLTEADAVAEHGPLLCSVCFPSAPVEWTLGIQKEEKPKCPGTGTWDHDSSGLRYASPRARCNHCGEVTSVTSTGKLRNHKPKIEG